MASDLGFVEYVSDRLRDAGRVRSRKMFGESAIYCDVKVVGLVCEPDRSQVIRGALGMSWATRPPDPRTGGRMSGAVALREYVARRSAERISEALDRLCDEVDCRSDFARASARRTLGRSDRSSRRARSGGPT
jgi:hypothetical protein